MKHEKITLKVAHNWPQTFFSQVPPGSPNQPRIDFSYHKMSGTSICSLICGLGPLMFTVCLETPYKFYTLSTLDIDKRQY